MRVSKEDRGKGDSLISSIVVEIMKATITDTIITTLPKPFIPKAEQCEIVHLDEAS